MMEIVLADGFDWSYSGMQLGPHTGEPTTFKTFEQLWEAFRTQYAYATSKVIRAKDIMRYFESKFLQMPFVSSIDDGCMEFGIDAMELSEQPNGWHNPITTVVAANSLVAIKKLIYDDKKYTMAQLITASGQTGMVSKRCARTSSMRPNGAMTTTMPMASSRIFTRTSLAARWPRSPITPVVPYSP